MHERRVVTASLLALCALAAVSCGGSARADFTLVVHMTGVRAAVEGFTVQGEPALSEAQIAYDGAFFYKDLTAIVAPSAIPDRFSITSLDGATQVSTVSLEPFVCKDAGLLGAVTETRDLSIDADGTLWTTGDFEHPFTSRCESPSMASGVATSGTSPGYCDAADRAATQVTLSDSVAWTPDRCLASYTNYANGVLSVVLTFLEPDQGGRKATLTLAHCIATGEVYPVTVALPVAYNPSCKFDAVSLSIATAGAQPTDFTATSGSWAVDAGSLQRGGRLIGTVAAQFNVANG